MEQKVDRLVAWAEKVGYAQFLATVFINCTLLALLLIFAAAVQHGG